MANYGYGQYEYQRNGPMPTGYPPMPAQYPPMPTSMASMQSTAATGMPPPVPTSVHNQGMMSQMPPAVNRMPPPPQQQQQQPMPQQQQQQQFQPQHMPPQPSTPQVQSSMYPPPPPVAPMYTQSSMPQRQPPMGQFSQQFQQQQPPPNTSMPPPPAMNQPQSPMYSTSLNRQPIPSYASQRPNLDPESMPSVVEVANEDLEKTRKDSSMLITARPLTVPPLVSTLKSDDNFIVSDGGSARPNHFRSTLYQVPISEEILKCSSLPFGIVITPFAQEEIDGKIVSKHQ